MSRYKARDASAAMAEARPAPLFDVLYQVKGSEDGERYQMLAPPTFVPGFVIFTTSSGSQMAYPAEIFVHISWRAVP